MIGGVNYPAFSHITKQRTKKLWKKTSTITAQKDQNS